MVYRIRMNNKEFAVKLAKIGFEAKSKNEADWLITLNKYNIGPKFLLFADNYLVYEFVNGRLILDYIKNNTRRKVIAIIKDVLEQCRILDKLYVNKYELHHPIKHIFVKGNKAFMIDFERCKSTEKPKNVTQFCQFLMSKKVKTILNKKRILINGEGLRNLLVVYKNNMDNENFNKILEAME